MTRGPSILCDSCLMRKLIRTPVTSRAPAESRFSPDQWNTLHDFASEFDQDSEEAGLLFSAKEFLDWMEPSILDSLAYRRVHEAKTDGAYNKRDVA